MRVRKGTSLLVSSGSISSESTFNLKTILPHPFGLSHDRTCNALVRPPPAVRRRTRLVMTSANREVAKKARKQNTPNKSKMEQISPRQKKEHL